MRHTLIVMTRDGENQDTSVPATAREMSGCPTLPHPGDDLEVLISALTPAGALTWRTLPAELPWTRPPGGSSGRPSDAQLKEVLVAEGVTGAACDYILDGPFTRIMVYTPKELDRNYGHAARAIEVAAEHDIAGRRLVDIVPRLSLTDHQVPIRHSAEVATGDCRGGRRYLRRGRKLLRVLGVWPWAHVENWRRTREWWEDAEVRHALYAWHDKAWMRSAQNLAWSASARFGARRFRAITVAEYDACLGFRAALELHAQAAEVTSGDHPGAQANVRGSA